MPRRRSANVGRFARPGSSPIGQGVAPPSTPAPLRVAPSVSTGSKRSGRSTRACPRDFAVDDDFVFWRDWGKKGADGKRTPDRVMKLAWHGPGKPEVAASAELYLDPVVLGDSIYFVDEHLGKDGIAGVMRVAKRGGKSVRIVPNASVKLLTDGLALYGLEPTTGKVHHYDPATGEPKLVLEQKGLSKVEVILSELYFSVCDPPKHCALMEHGANLELTHDVELDEELIKVMEGVDLSE